MRSDAETSAAASGTLCSTFQMESRSYVVMRTLALSPPDDATSSSVCRVTSSGT
jgi:hypothetical protein